MLSDPQHPTLHSVRGQDPAKALAGEERKTCKWSCGICGGTTKAWLVLLGPGVLLGHWKDTVYPRALLAHVAESQTSLSYSFCRKEQGGTLLFVLLSVLAEGGGQHGSSMRKAYLDLVC